MKLYLAGKMSGVPLHNFPAFDKNAAWLRSLGHEVISPADLTRAGGFDEYNTTFVFTEAHYQKAMRDDLTALMTCDGVAFMQGWETSRGAKMERRLAADLDMPFYRVDVERSFFAKELIIGIRGYAKSGKDTLANLMVEHLEFEQRAFATALKGTLYATNPWINLDDTTFVRLQNLIDDIGWDEAKVTYPECRRLPQKIGTEGGRENIHQDVWVRPVMESGYGPRLAISDTRFQNEVDAIRRRGGYIVRVNRPGVGPLNNHASETLDSPVDFEIQNDREPMWMLDQLKEFLSSVGAFDDLAMTH